MRFSGGEASFEGFRVSRAHPLALLAWTGVWLAGLVLMGLCAMPFLIPLMDELQAAGGDPNALSTETQRALEIASWATIPAGLLIQAILAPAVYRAVLKPQLGGFGYLRLGLDEVRVFAVVAVIGIVSFALSFAGQRLEILAFDGGGVLAQLGVGVVVLIATIWLGVQVSLIAPTTFGRARIVIKEPLVAARKAFWPLLGVTIIAAVMAVLVVLLLVLIGWPLVSLMSAAEGAPDLSAGLAALAVLGLAAFGMTLVSVIVWSPFAIAYRDLIAQNPTQT
ncbi:hypothetical protein [Brevundimonas sp.]|uniref:hypothetical protein n=1 Tax=Brevundimonas sp. TaxID=1871086 RepID=UPI002AB8DDCF|nr:hypothetical protein [Brevundimonas sp.]MDZ4364460.1 hypothetical protein [Brevundimonas sp.]